MQFPSIRFIPTISLRPDKLVLYNTIVKDDFEVVAPPTVSEPQKNIDCVQLSAFDFSISQPRSIIVPEQVSQVAVPEKKTRPSNAHGFELSPNAQKNLREKVSWLYHFAKNQTIKTTNGKVLAGFKMNFVTLKLPSVQQHTSDFITKNCLNQLFVEVAKKYQFRNYVWRLEYQKNGNLHYHIATDTYIDYYWLRSTWNRVLEKYGYVSAYKEKFAAMSLSDYCRHTDMGGAVDFDTLKQRYAEGCRNGWRAPNSVDVKCVTNHKKIAFYIAKYMGKGSKQEGRKILPVCEDNSSHSRLWFCSRSLSKLKAVKDFQECFSFDLCNFLDTELTVKRLAHDYCTCYYFTWKDLTVAAKRLFGKLFRDYAVDVGYISNVV